MNRGKKGTIQKSVTTNRGNGVSDGHARQAGATTERRAAYAGHRVSDGHTRQASATPEFATCCVSAIFD